MHLRLFEVGNNLSFEIILSSFQGGDFGNLTENNPALSIIKRSSSFIHGYIGWQWCRNPNKEVHKERNGEEGEKEQKQIMIELRSPMSEVKNHSALWFFPDKHAFLVFRSSRGRAAAF
jgi:hypothetical protein